MSITPLLRQLKDGYFLTFQGSGEDLTFTINNSNNGFKFSKYALLEIPPVVTSTDNKNTIQFQNIEGSFVNGLSTATPPPAGDRIDLSESLQNYLMNMETLLLNSPDYNPNTKLNASERLFFKWLKEIGAIRFREATDQENINSGTVTRFTEEDANPDDVATDLYDQVVRYIGEIDMEGSHRSKANSFREVYIYVPTQNGSTPTVMFKSVEDDNYKSGLVIKKQSTDNIEYIEGRDSDDNPTFAGLSALAIYDQDVPLGSLDYEIDGVAGDPFFGYLASAGPNAYFTESAFGDPTTEEVYRLNSGSGQNITYLRSKLDGIMIDFNRSNYKDMVDSAINSFNEFNASEGSESFQFNAILVYYDVFDKNNPDDSETNLFGVYFLKDMINISSGGAQIEEYTKIKPIPVLRQQGNGFGFKINIKFDITADNIIPEVDVSVNDYNTFAMELFAEFMARMGFLTNQFESNLLLWTQFKERMDDLEKLVISDHHKEELLTMIEEIRQNLVTSIDEEGLLELINKNSDGITAILQGNTTVGLDFFLDIRARDGLVPTLENNILTIRNKRQEYGKSEAINIDVEFNINGSPYNIMKLAKFTNLFYHENAGESKTAQNNVALYIDDSEFKWETNQVFELVVTDPIDMNGFGFIIYTDKLNRFGNTTGFQQLIGIVPSNRLVGNQYPTIKIVCIDGERYKFKVIIG